MPKPRQLDLFAATGAPPPDAPAGPPPAAPDPQLLDDDALVAALAGAGQAASLALAAEAGRRRLAQAVPALAALCARFRGFGREHEVAEQLAALDGLAEIGSLEAAAAVGILAGQGAVQGPGLVRLAEVAARLRAGLPDALLETLLRHPDPAARAAACGCVRSRHPRLAARLVALLADLHADVALAAACALGRLGRKEARGPLCLALRRTPTAAVIEAVAQVADHECTVLLGKLARGGTELAPAARLALADIDTPEAAAVSAALPPA